jgi:hypothetical protein
MRLLRIRLANFKGVERSDVEFAPSGVTVIEGPNEVGKSTIADALTLLFDYLDSSGADEVKRAKPVDRDAGPEVELEAEAGAYAFVYRKRWLREKETVLRITRPRAEQVTGREAHERMKAILEETTDTALWKALRLTQGDKVGQAATGAGGTLRTALDKAAGTVPDGPVETTLWERARAEYLAYWTPTGQAKVESQNHDRAVAKLRADVDTVTATLDKLESDIARFAELQLELVALAALARDADVVHERLAADWQRLQAMESSVRALEAEAGTARIAADQATQALEARSLLAGQAAAAHAEAERLAAGAAVAGAGLAAAEERAKKAVDALRAARETAAAADDASRAARTAVELLAAHRNRAELVQRRQRVLAAREALAKAQATLQAVRLDEAGLDVIAKADLAAHTARAIRDAAQPHVAVTALAPVAIEIGGESIRLSANDVERRSVATELEVVVPGVVSLRVAAGTGGDEAGRAVAAAEERLRALLAAAGVADRPAAEQAIRDRAEAGTARAAARGRLVELLGDDLERGQTQLDARIAGLEQQLAGAVMPAGELDAAIGAAEVAAVAAGERAAACRKAVEQAAPEEAAASGRLAELDKQAAVDRALVGSAREQARLAAERLSAAVAVASDAALTGGAADAAAMATAAQVAAAHARTELEAQAPGAAQAMLANAAQVRAGISEQIRKDEQEQAGVQARLRDHGEEGLAERKDVLQSELEATERSRETYRRAADARRFLFTTLGAARDEAGRAYIEPLRQHVEALGKIVFGPSLQIQVGSDLQVKERTLLGKTLPFDSLSVGAREQLGIITRLACAMIVAPEGGVPVILDDGLGWSDKPRLDAMGAVLKVAGEHCQVIVLTCYPDRYRAVGGAKVVRLG